MKKEIIIGLSLIVVIIVGMIYVSPGLFDANSGAKSNSGNQTSVVPSTGSSNVAGRLSHNLIIKSHQPAAINKVIIYKTIPTVVTDSMTLAYAKKFNVTGDLKGGCVVQSKDLRFSIEISPNSGRVIYSDYRRPNAIQDSPDKLPIDNDAIKIATKFLKDRDLYPEDAMEPVAVRENAYTIGKGNETYYGQIGVWYHRNLNDLKVEGTQLVVYIGGNGDVIGYFANWRDYEPYKELPVKMRDVAFGQMKMEGVGVGMNDKDSLVSINDAYLAYQTTPGAYAEDYLKPVWVFKGNVMVNDKPVMPVEKYIPALSEESRNSLSV